MSKKESHPADDDSEESRTFEPANELVSVL